MPVRRSAGLVDIAGCTTRDDVPIPVDHRDSLTPCRAGRGVGLRPIVRVLDFEHSGAVHVGVRPALVVDLALLGDGEVESDLVFADPGEFGTVLLTDGKLLRPGFNGGS